MKKTAKNQLYAPNHSGAVNRGTSGGEDTDDTLFISKTIAVVVIYYKGGRGAPRNIARKGHRNIVQQVQGVEN